MYIPENNEDLIKKCEDNNFRGTFSIENDIIIWKVTHNIVLNIILHNHDDEGYISIYYVDSKGRSYAYTHWHPENDEIFGDLQNINDNEIIVIRRDIFGRKKIIIDSKQRLAGLKNNIFFSYEKI
ncbi:MAG: hypothetical protein K2J32_05210 [Ruminococcus sp.]|nr:hypothetical protein [Ruminococcus sp.]